MAAGMMIQQILKHSVQTLEAEVQHVNFDEDLVKQREKPISQMMGVMEYWETSSDLKFENLEKRLHSHIDNLASEGARSPPGVTTPGVTDPLGLAAASEQRK